MRGGLSRLLDWVALHERVRVLYPCSTVDSSARRSTFSIGAVYHLLFHASLELAPFAGLVRTGISGVANLLPFTCLPGTIVASMSGSFRRDHEDLPWIDIAYDGQAETGIDTRLQAFMHQATEYSRAHDLDRPR